MVSPASPHMLHCSCHLFAVAGIEGHIARQHGPRVADDLVRQSHDGDVLAATTLRGAAGDPRNRDEAPDAIRGLIGRIVLTPGAQCGEMHATLRGNLGTNSRMGRKRQREGGDRHPAARSVGLGDGGSSFTRMLTRLLTPLSVPKIPRTPPHLQPVPLSAPIRPPASSTVAPHVSPCPPPQRSTTRHHLLCPVRVAATTPDCRLAASHPAAH